MSAAASTIPTVNGLRLLEACNFNRHICASIIAQQDNWKELLDSISSPDLLKNVAVVVWEIREALGLEAD
jgi:hypothetical protein